MPLYLAEAGEPHVSGAAGDYYFPEIMGAGGALFDYDGDGDLDLYQVQGGSVAGAVRPDAEQRSAGADRLYRTDVAVRADGVRLVDIVDVTERSALRATGYGMGVAAADVDNDGDVDIYVTNAGPNELWRNNGDGTFSDATRAAGVGDPRWSTSASFFDYDRDGWLDLFVANYVDFRVATHRECRAASGALDYCGPLAFAPEPDRLYRNRGDGTFEDVSAAAGVARLAGNGLGVVAADFDRDGWSDVYVANDQMVNFLWRNRGDGTFVEEAALAGCAVNLAGEEEASMGVVAADFDEDGALDLFLTHLDGETNTFYRGDGTGLFEDRTATLALAAPSLPYTGFGVEAIDLDLDGWQDLFVANGAVHTIESQRATGDPLPFRQPDQIFWNEDGAGFSEMDPAFFVAGGAPRVQAGRGVASGDRLRVGYRALVVFNNGGPIHELDALAAPGPAWLGVETGSRDAPAALGAAVTVDLGDGVRRHRRIHQDGSYCSSRDPGVLIGLGEKASARSLRIDWPTGGATVLESPSSNHYLRFPRSPR